ncbi:MAG: PTS sugar transporter subunit IIA [Planctomycetota bacterium]
MEFLKSIGLEFDYVLLNMATVLVAGIVGGEIFAKFKLPKVTGWIVTGMILRQLYLPGMDTSEDPAVLGKFKPYMNFVLGFIAFTVGASLYLGSLKNMGKRIGFLLIGEAIMTPLIVLGSMLFIGSMISSTMTREVAILLAAIAIAGAPGTTVLVIQEARARGILTRTLLAVIGLIDMVAVAVFVFLSTFLSTEGGWAEGFTNVGIQFGVTFAIGTLCAAVAIGLKRIIVSPAFLGPLMVAVVLGSWGLAAGLKTSGGILACTFAGIMLTNMKHDMVRSGEAYLTSIGGVLFALFFTFAGMNLDFTKVPLAAGLVALFFGSRLIAKSVNAFTAMTLAGVTQNVRKYLGIALLPHGGVAVGLILLTGELGFSDETKDIVNTVGLAALAINQLIGPSATRFSLTQSGEDHKDRPRLLDFLDEHRIVVGINGSKEDVVKKLTGLLYSTSSMEIPQNEFIDRVTKRDENETSCLGNGLMIPHAILDEVKEGEVKGVLGISSEGLDLGAPDGRVVHAVLLLATPEAERNRHLEIISAFATAITKDINIREQLYHARSAAHAYEVIHADDLKDLNYFLEDAQERAGIIQE